MAQPKLQHLGQVAPAAGTVTALYTVPAARRATISTLVVTSTGGATTFQIFSRINGAAAAVGNAIAYNTTIAANTTTAFTIGMTLAAADVISVQSAGGAVTFTLYGEETDIPAV